MEEQEQKILELLKDENYKPMKPKEIAILMRVPKNEYNDFLNVLGNLELNLKIQKNRKNQYRIVEKVYYDGIYRKHSKGFGFVKIESDEVVPKVFKKISKYNITKFLVEEASLNEIFIAKVGETK